MLREDKRTVAQMAQALHITENGIRAQLNALEEEGLVRQAGVLPGTRKPFNAYELTSDGEKMFPSAYGPLLCELLSVIGDRVSEEQLNDICDETARRVAAKFAPGSKVGTFENRLAVAVRVLGEMGGVMDVVDRPSKTTVVGKSCPVAELVKIRPRTCHFVGRLISAIVEADVLEMCDKGVRPRCCFEIAKA